MGPMQAKGKFSRLAGKAAYIGIHIKNNKVIQADILISVMLLLSSKCLCRKGKLYRIIVATLCYCTHPPNPVSRLLELWRQHNRWITGATIKERQYEQS
jgi:hypothetical protein